MQKRVFNILVFTALFLFLVFPEVANAGSSLSALDTVAGFETVLKASNLSPGSPFSFSVRAPSAKTESISTVADADGFARVTLSRASTSRSGIYQVSGSNSVKASFEVFPADMSVGVSDFSVDISSLSADGMASAHLTVRILDEFGNPLEYHEVKVTSSRANDEIAATSDETDENGEMKFAVSSREPGTAIFTALDETSGETLTKRVQINFSRADLTLFRAVGGDPEVALIAVATSTSSLPALFEFANIPATINLNEDFDFTVKAVDASGAILAGYTGTVVFSSSDKNAKFPGPFTFTEELKGVKTFSFGASLKTAGTQKLTVQDQSNSAVKGEKTIEVITAAASTGSQVRITKPSTATYSSKVQSVEGEVGPSKKVDIFDNGLKIGGPVQADSKGRFKFTTAPLKDGKHIFHVESNGVRSLPVEIYIDSTPAQVEDADFSRKEAAPGDTIEFSVRSDPDLTSIKATIGDQIFDLEPDLSSPGLYRTIFAAPSKPGVYTVNVMITDRQGNEARPVEAGKITVDPSLAPVSSGSFEVPSKVKSVQAIPGDSRVTLIWQPATAASGIAFYRIYWGRDAKQLKGVVNTKDAQTQWFVPGLKNGEQYFFRVVGVDKNGAEGNNYSDTISAVPSVAAGRNQGGVAGGGAYAGGSQGRCGVGGSARCVGDAGQTGAQIYTGDGTYNAVNGLGNYGGINAGGGLGADAYGLDGLGDGGISGGLNGYGNSPVLCDPAPCPEAGYPPGTPEDGPGVFGMIVAAFIGGSAIKKFLL